MWKKGARRMVCTSYNHTVILDIASPICSFATADLFSLFFQCFSLFFHQVFIIFLLFFFVFFSWRKKGLSDGFWQYFNFYLVKFLSRNLFQKLYYCITRISTPSPPLSPFLSCTFFGKTKNQKTKLDMCPCR